MSKSDAEKEKNEEKAKKVLGTLIVSIIADNPAPRIEVKNAGMNPYMIPTLLRQLAQNFEDAILKTKSLLE